MTDPLHDEVERLRARVAELAPYEVVSGEQWKARALNDKCQEQADEIKQLHKERDTLNLRIKALQIAVSNREADIERYLILLKPPVAAVEVTNG
jgi:uncharacterized protein YlxW (UPF0749 family)